MVEIVVRGPTDKVIRAHIVRGVSGPPEPTHAYLQVNGVARKVLIGQAVELTSGEVSALENAGFTCTPTGGA
jgi:hypothetical protein